MSRFKVEECCLDLGNSGNGAKFKADSEGFLANYHPLTETEKEALKSGDIQLLYKMDVTFPALFALARAFGYDTVSYIRKLREAAGLREVKEQIEILQRRSGKP